MGRFDEEANLNEIDNRVMRKSALNNNPYRGNLSITEYAKYLNVYALVAESYADFFIKYWYKDDAKMTNEKMTEELIAKQVITQGFIWTGLTEEENNSLGEYVLSLDCPATVDEMKTFFRRVMIGDLEFRCRYPMNDATAWQLIRENIGLDYL